MIVPQRRGGRPLCGNLPSEAFAHRYRSPVIPSVDFFSPTLKCSSGPIYGYDSESRGCLDIYRSPSESLFEFFSPKINISSAEGGKKDGERGRPGSGGRGRNSGVSGVLETCDSNASIAAGTVQASNLACFITSPPREEKREKLLHRGKTVCGPMSPTKGSTVVPPPNMQQEEGMVISYAGKGFDPRRMCTACTKELRGAIISSGHGLELWHTVDHERRALLMGQRQHDLLKARWAARERGERQVECCFLFVVVDKHAGHAKETC